VFERRSQKLERIDTGDYTPAEYDRFLREIAFINRMTGDLRTLKRTLFREIERENLTDFSVLDVGAGSGEMLRYIAEFARETGRKASLTGIDLNEISAAAIKHESREFPGISGVLGDAAKMPFADGAFDYTVCSLFTHHLPDETVVEVLREMARVSRRGMFVIDLHRHPAAYALYKLFCLVFRISRLVREDGSLSIKRSFKPTELLNLARKAGLPNAKVKTHPIYRLALRSDPSKLQ
jgi:ubiquinone/menaquinone biosynthesis C-methylase UbiE